MSGFSFGNTGGSGTGGASNPFGQAKPGAPSVFGATPATSTASTTSGLFGSSTATIGAPQSNMFGGASASGTSSLFGGASTGQKPMFGAAANSNSGSSTPASNIFGATTGGTGTPNTSTAPGTSNTAPTNLFGGAAPTFSFGTAQKSSGQATPTTEAPSAGLFGGGAAKPAAGNLFGLGGSSATPAKSASFSFANSTTPAGPPPADNATKPASNLFGGQQQPATGGGLFGAKPAEKPTSSQPASNMFGGGSTTAPAASQPATQLFGGVSASSAPGSSQPATTLFGGAKPASSTASTPATTTAAPASGSASAFSFGPKPTSATSSAPTPAPATPNLFGGGATSSAPPAASAKSGGLFGGVTSTPATSSAAPSANLFGAASKPSSTTAPASSATPATTAAPTNNLFGGAAKSTAVGTTPSTTTTSGATAATTAAAPATNPAGTNAAGALGASTAGPPPALSRLKNKTLDEIITRWASDLSKYQKEFQSQAAQVSSWDRLLVSNGDKIQKLYLQTFEAERASAEVERRLTSVESQQDELSAYLDRYERGVEELFEKSVGGPDGSLQGADAERERVYKSAERVEERLEEMMRDLSSMIGEVNEASQGLMGSNKVDDPLSQIVRVLNGHLTQLQWIDQNAATLQAKVAAAQKASQAQLVSGAKESDAADEFYKSFLGGGRR